MLAHVLRNLCEKRRLGSPKISRTLLAGSRYFQADIEFLKEKMEASLQDLSSYDEYVTEVRSGRLEWSPGTFFSSDAYW